MSSQECQGVTLRERQQAATREEIIDKAIELYSSGVEIVSHELIASEAGMSARTVYRHFPDRTALTTAIWQRLRLMTHTRFPNSEEEIIPLVRQVFSSLDEHAQLVKGVMASVAGVQLQRLPAVEAKASFTKCLAPVLEGLTPSERNRIVAPFVAIYSAPFWQLLQDRGGLSGKDAQESTIWLLSVLLQALHHQASQINRKKKTK